MQNPQPDLRSHEADVGGIRMRWDERGSGIPVVLVHGIPTSPQLWRKVMPLVDGARLMAWEMVGYGHSIPEGRGHDISVRAQAGYLLEWLDAQGLDRVVLVGHDLGGGVVQIAALRHPERCQGLLLTNAIGYDSWPIPSVKMLRAAGGLVRRLPAGMIKAGIFRMLMARGHDDAQVARESLALHSAPYAEHGAGEALARQVRSLEVNDTRVVAGELPTLAGVPARVVWGAADQFQKIEYGERFARDLDAPLERIEGGKHFTPEDHPDRIAAALGALLREVSERASSQP
ncbi:alpha/beta fold hydrolase [Lysobacter sp. D1-1-M9]|uniref:alpha/beta fold hydrolase n=1 Tax=Novilysobacter longmucuonensis TaxID=3098603 RepID=UPI002FC8BAB7